MDQRAGLEKRTGGAPPPRYSRWRPSTITITRGQSERKKLPEKRRLGQERQQRRGKKEAGRGWGAAVKEPDSSKPPPPHPSLTLGIRNTQGDEKDHHQEETCGEGQQRWQASLASFQPLGPLPALPPSSPPEFGSEWPQMWPGESALECQTEESAFLNQGGIWQESME